MSEVTTEVSGLTRFGGMVKGKVTITFDSDVVIGYSGNASDETLKSYLKDAAIEQLKYEVQGNDQ